jgi:hypothetical protein
MPRKWTRLCDGRLRAGVERLISGDGIPETGQRGPTGMLVSDLACREMEDRSRSVLDWMTGVIRAWLRRPAANQVTVAETDILPEPLAPLPVVPALTEDRFRWRKHPMLLERDATGQADLNDPGRGASAAATRGLFLARSGRFDDASEAFTIAAREGSIDLTAIPGFWELPRGGMLAAVEAYEATGRFREAASLSARVRLKFKLRLVPEPPSAPRSQTR